MHHDNFVTNPLVHVIITNMNQHKPNEVTSKRWLFALRYAGAHFLITLTLAVLVGVLVFWLWYPKPFRDMTGGLGLYQLILGVDIVCGPLLTLILASPKKTHKAMLVDISMIASIQLAALAYGLYTVAIARPVALVAEIDRFRIVSLNELYTQDKAKALPDYQQTPLWGIQYTGVMKATTAEAANKDLNLSLQGIEMGMRPDIWQPYDKMKGSLKNHLKPLSALKGLTLNDEKNLTKAIKETNKQKQQLSYLPIVAPMSDKWIALLDENYNVVGYANVNGW